MALGLFRHWSLTDLQQLHADASAAMLAGKNRIIKSTGAGDVSVEKEFQLDSKVFWEELNYALELLSPTSYTAPISRTRVRFS